MDPISLEKMNGNLNGFLKRVSILALDSSFPQQPLCTPLPDSGFTHKLVWSLSQPPPYQLHPIQQLTMSSSAPAPINQQEIVGDFNRMRQELAMLAQKIGELEQEKEEFQCVLLTFIIIFWGN